MYTQIAYPFIHKVAISLVYSELSCTEINCNFTLHLDTVDERLHDGATFNCYSSWRVHKTFLRYLLIETYFLLWSS